MTRQEADVAELPTEPGARLRRQRELAGLSEQQVAEQLNLDAGVVAAIEADDYAALGAPVFARGHLKRYAGLLGLAEDEILGAYERSKAQLGQPTLIPKAREEMAPVRGPSRWPWLVGGVLLFLLAAALAAYVSEYGFRLPGRGGDVATSPSSSTDATLAESGSMTTATADTQVTDGGQAGPGGTTGSAGSTPTPATGQAATAAAAVPVALAPGQVALQLAFATDSWVEIYDATGKAVLYDLGRAGTERTATGAAPLSVTLGNPGAVALRVNGQSVSAPVPPPGQTVARFGVGADGTVRSATDSRP